MKTTTRSFVSALALILSALGCNVDFVPVPETETESDAGTRPVVDSGTPVTPPPADAGTTPPPVDSGTVTPPPPVCGGASLQTDVANCGTCNNRCTTGQTCNSGVCTSPVPADAGTPAPTTDEWRLVYRAPSGAMVTAIQSIEVWDGSARECTLNVRDPEQRGAALTGTDRCPTMRFSRGATLRFNGRFTLAATSSSAPMPLENWSCHIDRVGGPMLPFGTVEAYKNGTRVAMRMVDNERGGCNWAPVSE